MWLHTNIENIVYKNDRTEVTQVLLLYLYNHCATTVYFKSIVYMQGCIGHKTWIHELVSSNDSEPYETYFWEERNTVANPLSWTTQGVLWINSHVDHKVKV